MSIGKNIKKARGQVRQSELAEKIGVDVATVSRWENDKNTPNGHMMQEIAKALNTTVSYLSGESEQYNHSQTQESGYSFSPVDTLLQKVTDKNTKSENPIMIEKRNDMYIIKEDNHEFCIPDNPTGQEIFLKLVCSMSKGMRLSEASANAKLNINNGTNSSYNNSTVHNGTPTVTQVEMSEIA